MARTEDEDNFNAQDDPATPALGPLPAPGRVSSSDVTVGEAAAVAAPRAARFGEGPEGRAARRERGSEGREAGFFERLGNFWHDVRAELKRVSWPSAKDVQATTIITIIAVAFFAAYLFAVDKLLTFLVEGLTKLLGG
ncbi:MAG: preprotein translocase subunit SecE [Pyrinomonadaceae bacterium]